MREFKDFSSSSEILIRTPSFQTQVFLVIIVSGLFSIWRALQLLFFWKFSLPFIFLTSNCLDMQPLGIAPSWTSLSFPNCVSLRLPCLFQPSNLSIYIPLFTPAASTNNWYRLLYGFVIPALYFSPDQVINFSDICEMPSHRLLRHSQYPQTEINLPTKSVPLPGSASSETAPSFSKTWSS